MTLLVSIHSPSFVVLLGDQRLSAKGKPITENANKLIAIAAADARLALGYTGLAHTADREFVTQEWLRKALCEAGDRDPTYLGVSSGIAALLAREFSANASIQRMLPRDRRLTIAVAGFVARDQRQCGVLALITNFQDFDAKSDYAEPWAEFRVKRLIEKTPPDASVRTMVQRFGAWPALREARALRIEDAVRAGKSAKIVATIASGFVRKAASERDGTTIGQQVNAIIVERERPDIELWFGSGAPTDASVFPDIAVLRHGIGSSIWGRFDQFQRIRKDAGEPSAWIPRTGARKPCPCGSGKQFKRCHGLFRDDTP
jgi:hypothetical protein